MSSAGRAERERRGQPAVTLVWWETMGRSRRSSCAILMATIAAVAFLAARGTRAPTPRSSPPASVVQTEDQAERRQPASKVPRETMDREVHELGLRAQGFARARRELGLTFTVGEMRVEGDDIAATVDRGEGDEEARWRVYVRGDSIEVRPRTPAAALISRGKE